MFQTSVFVVKESAPVVQAIMSLHFPLVQTVYDPTWGHGRFWDWSTPFQLIGSDIDTKRAKDFIADIRYCPVLGNSVDVVILDPPFYPDRKKQFRGKRGIEYGTVPSLGWGGERYEQVRELYFAAIDEALRISKRGLVVKCKDMLYSQTPCWIHSDIIAYTGTKYELRPEDMAVQVFDGTLISDPRWKTQRHFRRQESYWLIYKF